MPSRRRLQLASLRFKHRRRPIRRLGLLQSVVGYADTVQSVISASKRGIRPKGSDPSSHHQGRGISRKLFFYFIWLVGESFGIQTDYGIGLTYGVLCICGGSNWFFGFPQHTWMLALQNSTVLQRHLICSSSGSLCLGKCNKTVRHSRLFTTKKKSSYIIHGVVMGLRAGQTYDSMGLNLHKKTHVLI